MLKTTGHVITGYGYYYPEKILQDEEIRSRLKYPEMHPAEKAVIGDIGVTERFRANERETSVYMAAEATKMALKDANVKAEDIDLYLFCNWTERYYLPDLAPQASILSGTTNALAFDLGTACSGFVLGIQTASCYFATGKWKKAVVVGSERFSLRTKMGGFGEFTAGDAAAAVIIENTGDTSRGIIDFFLKDEGQLREIITCDAPKGIIKSYPDLIPNAAGLTLKAIDLMMERNQLKNEDISWVVPHPGTILVVDKILNETKLPKEKFLMNYPKMGNASAASIPTVLADFWFNGTIKKNQLILAPAVGGGFYWGAFLYIT
jgi:3-oxoacyl-[acyl-carrier-protein] synthase III